VELMRLAEARGTYDTLVGIGSRGRYRVSPAGVDQRWTGQSKTLLARKEAKTLGLVADALARIVRVIERADGVETALAPTARRDREIIHVEPSEIDTGRDR
jgi:hypothetical protein